MARWFNEYSSETSIHGLGLLFRSSAVMNVFWAVVVVVAIAFASNDFVNLVKTYKSEPTMLSVSVVPNTNFTFVTPTICMETSVLYVGKDNDDLTYHHNKAYDTVGIEKDIEKFRLATENATKLDFNFTFSYFGLNLHMDDRLYYYTYALVAYWTDAEMSIVDEQINFHRQIFTNWSHIDPNLLESLEKVYSIYRSYNVSLPYLKQIVGYHMCANLFEGVIKYKYYGDADEYHLTGCEPRLITHVGFSLICIRIFDTPTIQVRLPKDCRAKHNIGIHNVQ